MGKFSRFEDIEAWKRARILTERVYEISKSGAFASDFGLKDQIQRASVSIMANIAEGYERGGVAEFKQFLSHAKGSAGEVRSHLYVALDQKYITKSSFENIYSLDLETARMIGGLMNYLQATPLRGSKYAS